jgi:effector-binding domain-containing protein
MNLSAPTLAEAIDKFVKFITKKNGELIESSREEQS